MSEISPNIPKLASDLLDTIELFSTHSKITTGEVMGALFSVLVMSAKASPNYDPRRLIAEVDEKIRQAVAES
jgi:hypothetical protein